MSKQPPEMNEPADNDGCLGECSSIEPSADKICWTALEVAPIEAVKVPLNCCSAPADSTYTQKRKLLLDEETSHQDKKLEIKLSPGLSSDTFQKQKHSKNMPAVMETIACSGLSKNEVEIIKMFIKNLSTHFTFHINVLPTTSYLITKSPLNRTMNIVFGMAYGCKIINENWVYESVKTGRLLPHEHYLITELSTPVKEFQAQRSIFGSLYLKFDVFHNIGRIYVANTCEPSALELKRLVHACGGKCTDIESKAFIVVGKTGRNMNNVKESWILDCVVEGMVLSSDSYLYDNSNNIEN